ncbi:MAG: GNAT family N-acetyltransferase [Alphaproteobacteria bacterium]|nr:MAG: GNAT family N-acetyltransferase [Alphaproteobacteria bacterium]
MPSSRLSIRIINTLEEFETFQEILRHFENTLAPTPIVAPSLERYWLLAFARVYGPSRKLAITIVFDDNFPQLILPLQLKDDASLEFLCDETADYNDFFYGDMNGTLIKYALDYWKINGVKKIRLDRLHPNSRTIELLYEISKGENWDVTVDDCDSFAIVNVESNKEIQEWSGIQKNAIKRYLRKQNALKKIADVKFSFVNTKSQLIEIFPLIQRMHINRWDIKGIYSKYTDPRRQEFILNVCQDALNENGLFLPIMQINGKLVSFIIGFRSGNTIYDWNTAFSVEYFKWSPGALLLLYVLSNYDTFSFTKYNLMRGLESYKLIWTNTVEKSLTVTIRFR